MTTPIRFFGAYPPVTSGTRAVSADVATRLVPCGWHPTLVSTRKGRLLRAAELLLAARAARHTVSIAHLDVYSGSAFRWAEGVSVLLQQGGVPFVATLHGGALPEFMTHHPRRVSRMLARAAAVVAPSGYLQQAAAQLGVHADVIPNGIDRQHYPHRVRAHPAPRLVWVRAFHRMYQPALAVEVLARVAKQHPGASLLMVGPDKDGTRREVERLAGELKVAHNVTFTGGRPKTDIPDLLASGDIFLNTTTVDNMPVSVLEAAACGLCIVSTNVGGVPWLVRNEEEALLVNPGDADGMAQAVLRVLAEAPLAARLSTGALALADAHDWATIVPRWDHLFRQVGGRRVAQ